MKKMLCMLMALVLSVSLAVPVFAADGFVPSITYKDGPEVNSGTANGEKVTACLVVTSISEAMDKSTSISQEERDLLLELYDLLDRGEMKLPIANDHYVIRDLVDVSYSSTDCVEKHDHEDWLNQEDNTVAVDFDMGVSADAEVIVMVYNGEEWIEAEQVTNRGNGIVSVVFEYLGATVFCVKEDAPVATPEAVTPEVNTPETGDTGGQRVLLWGAIMAGSIAVLLILIVLFKRSEKEEDQK